MGKSGPPRLLFISHSLALGYHTRQDGDRAEELLFRRKGHNECKGQSLCFRQESALVARCRDRGRHLGPELEGSGLEFSGDPREGHGSR